MDSICRWKKQPGHWDLLVNRNGSCSVVATVYPNGTWHTWDRDGVGGENDVEDSVRRAKTEAAAAAIDQGFI